MNELVKSLMETWQMLAQEVIRLNESANDMIKVERELAIAPYLIDEIIEDLDESPLVVIAAMKQDKNNLHQQLVELAATINNTQPHFSHPPESTELQNLSHNTQAILKFLGKIDLDGIEQSLESLVNNR
ncbi:hypothetical protein NIES2119_29505 [[Phormidium ambiguum] IAM M-71]|uniref:Uncharacterized protein n=1 Tax=[Phormidium ambiguum] IAM M-71 TaxID=454136 RepID=A0A1U7I4K2_9CYAN|nr:hypothetical protein [Phormidium ambiguum]OKH31108.1 hypothetical protein NIES2119_29505 [Phormidium ambiguum IAM M-71]